MAGNSENAPADGLTPGTVVEDQREAVDYLSSPGAHDGNAVKVIETHGAYVFLAGARALKMKRAVWFPYMDFSTLEKRRAACEAELRLNRRTAPSIYREVLPLTRAPDGGLALGGRGEVVDWVVAMARFDEDTLFDRLAQRGALTDSLLDALADAIADFHASAELRPDTDIAAAMRGTMDGNADSLRSWLGKPFEAGKVERVDRRCQALLKAASPLLAKRAPGGFVRHCHGDLHLRNICLVDGKPTLFDCIEFKESFAVIDVLYDLSFLLMDLEHRGLRREANRVLNRYLARTGDYDGIGALQLYLCARAEIRAHVSAAVAAAQDDPEDAARDRDEAGAYLSLAEAFAAPAAPALIAVSGLSGSGKTTLAQSLAPGIGGAPGAVTLRSDVLRKRRFGVDLFENLPEAAYTRAESTRVYDEIYRKAGDLLASGISVIADAVFRNEAERRAIAKVAGDAGVPFAGIWLAVSPSEQDARLETRTRDVSDATVDIGRAQRRSAESVTDWPNLNADMDIADLCKAAAPLLAKVGIRYEEP
jgi:aminoglycoside phosphotransferase family enzyme/predicted kinase